MATFYLGLPEEKRFTFGDHYMPAPHYCHPPIDHGHNFYQGQQFALRSASRRNNSYVSVQMELEQSLERRIHFCLEECGNGSTAGLLFIDAVDGGGIVCELVLVLVGGGGGGRGVALGRVLQCWEWRWQTNPPFQIKTFE